MTIKVLTMDHRALRTQSEPYDLDKENPINVANKLKIVLSNFSGHGLAANQIGINKRMFVYKHDGKFVTVINPVITETSDELWNYQEGCLSIPGFWWNVDRPKKINLKGFDLKGNEIEIETTKITARIFQHEMDHINGKLVIDHIPAEELAIFKEKWSKRKHENK